MNEIEKVMELMQHAYSALGDCVVVPNADTQTIEILNNALRSQLAREQNEPLTLEELKGMDGEPIWCIDGAGNKAWCVVNAKDDDCIDNECGAWQFSFYELMDGTVLNKQLGWLAYRNKHK